MGKNAPFDVLATEKLRNSLGGEQCGLLHGLLSQERFSHGANFEKLGLPKRSLILYSLRLNQKARVLLTKHELGGRHYWILLDYLEHHEYDKSPFLKPGYLKQYLSLASTFKELKSLSGQDLKAVMATSTSAAAHTATATAAASATATAPAPAAAAAEDSDPLIQQELYSFNRELIVLNQAQEKALALSEPMMLTGMPGSGKSCVAMTYLTQCLYRTEAGAPPLLYVAESDLLVKQMAASFRASPLGQTAAAQQVLFLSYDELLLREYPELKQRKRAGRPEFALWFNGLQRKEFSGLKAQLGPQAAELVYQELRMMSGMTLQEYEAMGERASPLWNSDVAAEGKSKAKQGKNTGKGSAVAETTDKAKLRAAIYQLKKDYSAHLVSNKDGNQYYDSAFLALPPQSKSRYSHIAIDEAQDFSTEQLTTLHGLALKGKNGPCVAYFADSHQSVEDNFPKHHFFKTILGIIQQQVLPGTYRCSKAVLEVANTVLALKYHVMGGQMEKGGQAFIASTTEGVAGSAQWITQNTEHQDAATQQHLNALANSTQCAVITAEEWVNEAQTRFPKAIILTPKQAKGLEYDHIILYRLLEHPAYKKMNPLLQHFERGDSDVAVHRAKAGEADYEYNALLNALFTAITRARHHLYLFLPHDKKALHPIQHLVNAIKQAMPQTAAAPKVSAASVAKKEDWQEQIRVQLTNANRSVALHLAKAHLGMSETEFNQQFPQDDRKTAQEVKPVYEYYSDNRKKKEKTGDKKDEKKGLTTTEQQKEKKTPLIVQKAVEVLPVKKKTVVIKAGKSIALRPKITPEMQAVLAAPDNQSFKPIRTFLHQDNFVEQLFHVNLGQGMSLYDAISNNKRHLLCKTLKNDLKNVDIAKNITLEALCRPRPWAQIEVNSTPLYHLSYSPAEVELFDDLLSIYFKDWIQSPLFMKALYAPLPDKTRISGNTSVLYNLCSAPKGRVVLRKLVNNNLNLFATKEFAIALCRSLPATAGGNAFTSCLYFLCGAPEDQQLLAKLIDHDPKVFATKEFVATLFLSLPAAAGDSAHVTGIHWLSIFSDGHSVLSKLFEHIRELLVTSKFVTTLYRTRLSGEYANISALYWLCSIPTGRVLLLEWVKFKPHLFDKEELIAAICHTGPESYKQLANVTGLLCLSEVPEGLEVLLRLIAINPDLFAIKEVEIALCLPCVAPHRSMANTSVLYWLCASPEGLSILDKLIDINPHLCTTKAFISTLILKRPPEAKLHANKSALLLLQDSVSGKILLDKITKLNPAIVSIIDVIKKKETEGSATSIEDTEDQRFFSALPPSTASKTATATSSASLS